MYRELQVLLQSDNPGGGGDIDCQQNRRCSARALNFKATEREEEEEEM
jgi:hypothetical protein